MTDRMALEAFQRIASNVGTIQGKHEVSSSCCWLVAEAMFSWGHPGSEDPSPNPSRGRSTARSTDPVPPDLLPSGVTISVYDGDRRVQFKPGPIFANIVVGDEITASRATVCLLEARGASGHFGWGEARATPFMVVATQNPWARGTYPLPERSSTGS